ncbi:7TM-DISM domain-containing protein [Colwellia sp. RE-S-Sl-9]
MLHWSIRILSVFFALFARMTFATTTDFIVLEDQHTVTFPTLEYQAIEADFDTIKELSTGWATTESELFNVGFSPSTFWLKVKLKNQSRNDEWFLTLDNTRLDFVDFYLLNGEGLQYLSSGDHRPISGQSSSSPTFKFYLAQNQSAQLYIRVRSEAKIDFTPKIRGSFKYGEHLSEVKQIHVFYVLILLMFVVFQLALNQRIINKINLYYITSLCFGFAYSLFYYGEGNLLFWPDNIILKNRGFFVFAMMSYVFSTLFLQKYLRSRIISPHLHYLLNCFLVFLGVSIIIILFPVTNMVRVVLVLLATFAMCLFILIGTVRTIRYDSYWAMGLAVPLFFTILALIIYTFTFLGVLPSTTFTSHLILWSMPLDILMISVSLVFRHSALRRERDALLAKMRNISLQQKNMDTGEVLSIKPSLMDSNQCEPNKRLSNINTDSTILRLIQYLEHDKPFLEPGISVEDVALHLQVRPDQLSTLINKELHTSFPTLINIKRLEAAGEQLKTQPNKTVLDIALECGFGSKSSFNRLFKGHFNTTPSLYRK